MTFTRKKNGFFNRFVKNSFFFLLGTMLSKAMSFFLIPLYSNVIPTADMGEYDVSITIMTMVSSICYFEIWSGVLRRAYEKKSTEEKIDVIAGGLQIFTISSLAFIAICLSLCFFIGYRYKYLILIYMLSYMLSNFLSFASRSLGYNKRFAISGFIATFLTIIFNLFLLLVVKLDFSALYISSSIGFIGQSLFLLFSCKLYKSFFHLRKWKKGNFTLIKFCLPLCINSVSYWCLTSFNRVIFNNIYGDSASGIFAIGSRFGTLVILVTTCFNYAWQDLSFSEASKNKNSINLYANGCNLYMRFLTVGFLIFVPALYFVAPVFVKGDYKTAINLIPLFILSSSMNSFIAFLSSTFYAIKDTKSIMIATLIGMVVNMLICYPIIKVMGPDGVNASSCISFLLIIIIMCSILKKKINLKIDWEFVLPLFAISVLSYISFVYFDWRANLVLLITGVLALCLVGIRTIKAENGKR